MARAFTDAEYVLCTYAAINGEEDLGGFAAMNLNGHTMRSVEHNSIEDKIRNIVADLKGVGKDYCSKWRPLSGTTTHRPPRYTRWDIVEPLTHFTREELLAKCIAILARS
jgi:hypothetical protein